MKLLYFKIHKQNSNNNNSKKKIIIILKNIKVDNLQYHLMLLERNLWTQGTYDRQQ